MNRSILGAASLAAALLSAPLVRAQEGAPVVEAPLGDALQGPAKEAYTAAGELFERSEWAAASRKYEEAYELSKDPRLLFNMALCARDLGQFARMRELLLRYERESGATLSVDEKGEIEVALRAIADRVGLVRLSANEAGASVTIDGRAAGLTPLPDPLVLDVGKHHLLVRKEGFLPVERTIESLRGEETTETVTLLADVQMGKLIVYAEPGATVRVDGRIIGQGHVEGTFTAGAHSLEVTKEGKKAHHATVEIRPDERRGVHVTLGDEGGTLVWPWIVGGVAVAAGAAVGGYFLFRPDEARGEGPRGSLGTVELDLGFR